MAHRTVLAVRDAVDFIYDQPKRDAIVSMYVRGVPMGVGYLTTSLDWFDDLDAYTTMVQWVMEQDTRQEEYLHWCVQEAVRQLRVDKLW